MKGDKMPSGQGNKRWMPIVLAVSLALNFAVIAAFTGAAMRHKGGEGARGPTNNTGAIYMRALPPDVRKQLMQEVRSAGRGPRFDPAEMVSILRQTPFDADAAEALLTAERDAGLAHVTAMGETWLKGVTQMSPQDRSSYADRLQMLADQRMKGSKNRKGG